MIYEDYIFMIKAIEEAKKAKDDEGRVGAVLVQNGKLVCASGSSSKIYPVIHAEHAVLEKSGWLNDSVIKPNSTIYVTLQPCIKRTSGANGCSFEIANSGIERVIFGALDKNFGMERGMKFFISRGIKFEQTPNPEIQKVCEEIFYKNYKINY